MLLALIAAYTSCGLHAGCAAKQAAMKALLPLHLCMFAALSLPLVRRQHAA